MVRVVYRWQVLPQNFDAFRGTWRITTNRIHETVPGAQGSFMMRSIGNESEVITVAKWDSLAEWEKFWGNKDPEEMKGMGALGKRIAVETFEEVEDYTR